jgi:hypothetical protein
MSKRDEFSIGTKRSLALRVNHICSNPDCKAPTSGPHTDESKATILGVAAHITSAAPNGPRYNSSLTPDERTHPKNGIWLCVNCSTIIDKDPARYNVQQLLDWKTESEKGALNALQKGGKQTQKLTPFIEVDLIWSSASRSWIDYSEENFKPGERRIIQAGERYISFYDIGWRFDLLIHNNSSLPVFNVSLEQNGGKPLNVKTKLQRINNIQPFQSKELKAEIDTIYKGYYNDAEILMRQLIPDELKDVELIVSYEDENRYKHKTKVTFKNQGLVNTKLV